ncbi:hypothetical protein MNBD_GAMMA04-1737 [hydrothermal vent metagenome]|uniref:Flagellar hook-length control protein-like C-terminal domain-containing protein n=2 Tax=hydrothermal vent metagenome TaxID=652676 RepID=A0A3B0VUR4_9ZZZZ
MQIKMVYISNNNPQTLSPTLNNLNSIQSKNTVLQVGQVLNATIKPLQGNQVQINMGTQTLLATSKEASLPTGTVQVQVKQTQPSIMLAIISNKPTPSNTQVQQTLQANYRQLMPAQTNISQAFQQISLLQALPPSLLSPINQLLDQMLKSGTPLSGKELKSRLEQSGLFLESKLKNSEQPKVQNDLKAKLLSLKQQTETLQAKSPSSQLTQLASLLTQAINRLTVQQLQLYENPLVTPLELPFERNKGVHKNTLEFRQNQNTSPASWELLMNIDLPQGELFTKLLMNQKGEISCIFWCETNVLESLVKEQLDTLNQQFLSHELPVNTIQIVPQKPITSTQSTQVALIDIHI